MRLRVMSDDHSTALLYHGGEIKAFVAGGSRGAYHWAVMPYGPVGVEGSPEEALAAIRMAIEQGEDVVLIDQSRQQDMTEMGLPAVRRRDLLEVGTIEVLPAVSGMREIARRASRARSRR